MLVLEPLNVTLGAGEMLTPLGRMSRDTPHHILISSGQWGWRRPKTLQSHLPWTLCWIFWPQDHPCVVGNTVLSWPHGGGALQVRPALGVCTPHGSPEQRGAGAGLASRCLWAQPGPSCEGPACVEGSRASGPAERLLLEGPRLRAAFLRLSRTHCPELECEPQTTAFLVISVLAC